MTAAPTVSVVVASHRRPEALKSCLKALTQLDYAELEVVVAADAAGLATVAALGLAEVVKTAKVEAPGISAARNAGLALAAGDVVAFIDDDATAEPSWLRHLAAPFANPEVAAAGGFVRGRNGISFQWQARTVDETGAHTKLNLLGTGPALHRGAPGRAIRTEGTNMAFRRATLADLGGFDPAYRYFMDETDVNMRLALAGAVTAVVPLAQVHHGFAPNHHRVGNRAPRDLTDIGASTAVYLRKFAPPDRAPAALQALRDDQRRRLLGHMVSGRLEPGRIAPLLAGLEAGIGDGMQRRIAPLPPLGTAPPFLKFPAAPGRVPVALAGRVWQARRLRRDAAQLAAAGQPVTLFLFSPTALYHRVRFRPEGFWEQKGGLFGRSDRSDPPFRLSSFARRLSAEMARWAPVRAHLGRGADEKPRVQENVCKPVR